MTNQNQTQEYAGWTIEPVTDNVMAEHYNFQAWEDEEKPIEIYACTVEECIEAIDEKIEDDDVQMAADIEKWGGIAAYNGEF